MLLKTKGGKYIVIDGIDGSGKGTIIDIYQSWAIKQGYKILDLKKYWQAKHDFPEEKDFKNYDVLLSAEPTFSLVGQAIREEILKNNQRHYSAYFTAQAFSLDREILHKRVILPALKLGKIIFQERSVTTSVAYQPIQAEKLPLKKIISLEGNRFALKHLADDIILTLLDPKIALARLHQRINKQDDHLFEQLKFLTKLDQRYRARWYKRFFEKYGSKIFYLDTNCSLKETKEKALLLLEKIILKK